MNIPNERIVSEVHYIKDLLDDYEGSSRKDKSLIVACARGRVSALGNLLSSTDKETVDNSTEMPRLKDKDE